MFPSFVSLQNETGRKMGVGPAGAVALQRAFYPFLEDEIFHGDRWSVNAVTGSVGVGYRF